MRSIREYKFASILTPILVIIEVVLEILIPLIMAKMIDMGISGNDEATLIKLGTILIISVFLGLFFWYFVWELLCCCFSRVCPKFKKRLIL